MTRSRERAQHRSSPSSLVEEDASEGDLDRRDPRRKAPPQVEQHPARAQKGKGASSNAGVGYDGSSASPHRVPFSDDGRGALNPTLYPPYRPIISRKNGKVHVPMPMDENNVIDQSGSRSVSPERRKFKPEYDRMREEIGSLKEARRQSESSAKEQTRKIEELTAELNSALSRLKEKEDETLTLKDKCKQKEELLHTIESSINCQICMDLTVDPYALSPCGHVLCLTCLQEWFRSAPSDSDTDDVDPYDVLWRPKSCPTCRTVIQQRPVPVFMVKAVSSALMKSRPDIHPVPSNQQDTPANGDPWKGIFPPVDTSRLEEELEGSGSDDEDEAVNHDPESDNEENFAVQFRMDAYALRHRFSDSSDSDDVGEDEDDADDDSEGGIGRVNNYSSDEDEPMEFVRVYELPTWEPPPALVPGLRTSMRDDEECIELLRRGCTYEMVQAFDMAYFRTSGLVAHLRSLEFLESGDYANPGWFSRESKNRVFLGWSIILQDDDVDGMIYLANVLLDIKMNPSRWQITPRTGSLRNLVDAQLVIQEDDNAYDSTESDSFVDAESWI
ncbi:hypothetical protein CPC08DRAFT_705467 [Agrocybe pediades]|nr:hypothetical protein CPC08DRAFT_705467 [Agrocybe pediades]